MVGTLHKLVIAVALVCCGAARAETPSTDAIARSRTHFEAGRALYNLGNYTDAIREFSAGYHDVPKPQFLVNLGQCYRKLNDLPRAREMYNKFLAEAPPDDPDREQAVQIVADLDLQIAATPKPPEPAPVASATTQGDASITAQPPARKSWIKRNWWVIPVGAVVVGAALGVGLGLGLQPKQVDCASASLGCIDTMTR